MKIFLIGNFSKGTLEFSYYNSFKKSGYDIVQFDYLAESKLISPLAENRFIKRICENFIFSILNKRLLEKISFNKPELILVFKGQFIFPATLKEIKRLSSALIFNFNPDNPFNLNRGASNNLIRGAIPLYDCYFIWGKFLIPALKNAGAKRIEYLPFACDPDFHYPVSISNPEKNIYGSDIAFIGTWDEDREKWLENLVEYDLTIWGNSWEKLKRSSPLRPKWKQKEAMGENFSKICSASKIILNFIRKQNNNAHNMRTFEVPACKGFMLTTRTMEQCEFFEEDKEMIYFETINELKAKINKYLSNELKRQQISSAAYEVVQAHTYPRRIKKILETYADIKKLEMPC